MKAIVLAGGYATRLWPITKHRAKPLLPLAGKRILDFILEDLENEERIDKVYISTNKRFKEDFNKYLENSDYKKTELFIEDTKAEDHKLGTLGAIRLLVEEENIQEDCLVVAGDNFYSFSIGEFLNQYESSLKPMVALYDVGSKELARKYGVVSLDFENKINDFKEKPEEPKSTLASTACYLLPENTLKRLFNYLDNGGNPDEPGNFIQWLYKRDKVIGFTFDDYWFDVGSPEAFLDAQDHFQQGNSIEGECENCEVGENVRVMKGAHVKDSQLENVLIFPETEIKDCTIKNSIIDRDTSLHGIDVNEALIGEHTKLVC